MPRKRIAALRRRCKATRRCAELFLFSCYTTAKAAANPPTASAMSAPALAAVAFPLYVIRPFRYQGPQELRLALAVLRWSPWITVLCALATLLLAPGLWQAFAARRLAGLRRAPRAARPGAGPAALWLRRHRVHSRRRRRPHATRVASRVRGAAVMLPRGFAVDRR